MLLDGLVSWLALDMPLLFEEPVNRLQTLDTPLEAVRRLSRAAGKSDSVSGAGGLFLAWSPSALAASGSGKRQFPLLAEDVSVVAIPISGHKAQQLSL